MVNIRRIILGCFSMLLVALGADISCACIDTEVTDSIVGVSEDGTFVLHRYGIGGADCHFESVIVYSRDGQVVSRYDSNTIDTEDCSNHWSVDGDPPVQIELSEDTPQLIERLKLAMGLKPLRGAEKRISVQQGAPTCMATWLVLPLGWYPIWTVSDMPFGDCTPVTMKPLMHPRSPLLFLAYSYTSGQSCTHAENSVHWVHPQWIDAVTWYRRALRLFQKKRYRKAQKAAMQSIQHHSGLLEARLLLARVLMKQHILFNEAKAHLETPFSPHLRCESVRFYDFVSSLLQPEFEHWQQSPEFEDWLCALGDQHDLAHPGENNPLSAWGPNTVDSIPSR